MQMVQVKEPSTEGKIFNSEKNKMENLYWTRNIKKVLEHKKGMKA